MSTIPGNTTTTEVLSPLEIIDSFITGPTDADWFRVTLSDGLSYGFTAASSGGPGIGLPDPDVHLYNSLGNQVGSATNGSFPAITLSVNVPNLAGGTYYVGVSDNGFNDTGNYRLTWNSNDTVRNDAASTAVLAANTTVTSAIDVAADSDWFKVTMQRGLTYGFEARSNGAGGLPDPDMFIRDTAGNLLLSATNGSFSIYTLSVKPNTSADYFVEVSDNGFNDVGGYTLSFIATDTIRHDVASTRVLNQNREITSRIDVAQDSDWFKLSLTAGISYGFQVAASGITGLPDGDLFLRDAGGNVIFSSTNGSNSINTLNFTALTTGTYFLEVSDNGFNDTGNYAVRSLGSDSVQSSTATTTTILAGESLSSAIDVSGDKDWFRLEGEQGVTYTLRLEGDGSLAELANVRLILRDHLGNVIATQTGVSAQINVVAGFDGPFFVEVQGLSGSDLGKYDLTVSTDAASITGSNAAERMTGGAGNTTMNLLGGNDRGDGGLGNDLIFGAGGEDTVLGSAGNDTLFGGTGNDSLSGGSGNDRLFGQVGDDTLRGGLDADRFMFLTSSGNDTIADFQDRVDRIQIEGLAGGFAGLTISQSGDDVRVSFGSTVITLQNLTTDLISTQDFIFT